MSLFLFLIFWFIVFVSSVIGVILFIANSLSDQIKRNILDSEKRDIL